MPQSAAARPYDATIALQEAMQRGREALRAQNPDDLSFFYPETDPAPLEGRRAPDMVGSIAGSPSAPRAGGLGGGGSRYPDLVPNNLVPSTSVPIKISDVFKNKTDISIGRARYHIAIVGTRKPRDFCGNIRTLAAACPEKPGEHEPKLIPQTCGRRVCDECWDTWAMRAAARGADCLTGYLSAKFGDVRKFSEEEIRQLLPRHVSFHPPDFVLEELRDQVMAECVDVSQFPQKFLNAFRKLCEEIIQGAGSTGGLMVLHEIRLRDEVRCDNELSTNRYRSVLKRKDWIYHVKYYPHVHALMFGPLEDAAVFHERTKWTYRNHSAKDPIRSPEGLIFYLLSHGTASPGIHAYSYYGEMSPRRLVKIGERIFQVPEECDKCKAEGALGPSYRVISYLHKETLKFTNDGNREALMRFGAGSPVLWGFDTITDRVYLKTVRIGEYRLLSPGTRWKKPRWKHTGLDKEALDWIRSGGKDDPPAGFWFVKGTYVHGWAEQGDPVRGIWLPDKEWRRYRPDLAIDKPQLAYLEADLEILPDWFTYSGAS